MKFKVGDKVNFIKIYNIEEDKDFEYYKQYTISSSFRSKIGTDRYYVKEANGYVEEYQIVKSIPDNDINRLLYPEYIEIDGILYPGEDK
jgi:hypothetical protein